MIKATSYKYVGIVGVGLIWTLERETQPDKWVENELTVM